MLGRKMQEEDLEWLRPEAAAQIMRRRSRLHPLLGAFSPTTTALIVIDMQRGYLDPEFGSVALPVARNIVPSVNKLSEALRRAGGHVVWVKSNYRSSDAPVSGLNHAVSPDALRQVQILFSPSHEAYSLWPELTTRPEDSEVSKNCFAAFYGSGGVLDDVLKERQVDTVLIAGLQTSICCETTAREASVRGLKTIMVADANAGRIKSENDATFSIVLRAFGDVLTSDQLILQMKIAGAI